MEKGQIFESIMSDSSDSEVEIKCVEPVRNSSSESSYDEYEDEDKTEVVTPEVNKDDTLVQSVQDEEIKMSDTSSQARRKPRRKRFIPKYDVEGVVKIILGEETQQQIEVTVGVHVTVQYPWKEVPKAKIMESINVGGELSEFFCIKEEIEAYSDENVLIGYIVDESKDTDEYYVCCTKEARDHCKQQSDRFIKRQKIKLEKALQKKPRPWISLGSEREILGLVPRNTRNLMEVEIKFKFPTEYEPYSFQVRDADAVRDGYIELTPYRQKFNNVFKRRVDCACLAAPPLIDRPAQTVLKYPQNKWTQSIADAIGEYTDGAGGASVGGGDDSKPQAEGEVTVQIKGSDDEEDKEAEQPDEAALVAYRAAFQRFQLRLN